MRPFTNKTTTTESTFLTPLSYALTNEDKYPASETTQPEGYPVTSGPKFTVACKLQALRQYVLEDQEVSAELAYYIQPNGQSSAFSTQSEPLQPWIEKEFLHSDARVLLLKAPGGAGKSTFNHHLLRQLWQVSDWVEWKPGEVPPKASVPIFIPLGCSQVNPKRLLAYLSDLPKPLESLTDEEINVLKEDYHLLLIADGYDEIPGSAKLNLYDVNGLGRYAGRVKLLISSRDCIGSDSVESYQVVPHQKETGRAEYRYYRERFVSPFTELQIADYLELYLTKNKERRDIALWPDVTTYQKYFKALPELQLLITIPFLLWITAETLPTIVQAQEVNNEVKDEFKDTKDIPVHPIQQQRKQITRLRIYSQFIEQWFHRQAEKAIASKDFLEDPDGLLGEKSMITVQIATGASGDLLEAEYLKQAYRQFCQLFADYLQASNRTSVQYPAESKRRGRLVKNQKKNEDEILSENSKWSDLSWVPQLFGINSSDWQRVRKGCPLRQNSLNEHQFIHASLIDYFVATISVQQAIIISKDKVLEKDEIDQNQSLITNSLLQSELNITRTSGLVITPTLDSQIGGTLSKIKRRRGRLALKVDPATQRLFDSKTIGFRVDELKEQPEKSQHYWNLIERSKTEEFMAIGAANSITILNVAGKLFTNRDFQGIRIQGAVLAGSYWERVDLRGADLSGVDLSNVWMNHCRLEGARLAQVHFGQFPNITTKEEIYAVVMHPCNPALMAIAAGKIILIYDLVVDQVICTLIGHSDSISCLIYSPDGTQLASGSSDNTVRLWDPLGEKPSQVLKGHSGPIDCLVYSPNGAQLASGAGNEDSVVRLWDPHGEKPSRELVGHLDCILCLAYSPDGTEFASGSHDDMVRLWDPYGEKPGQMLAGHSGSVYCLAYSPNGTQLASGGEDSTVRLWDPHGEKPSQVLEGHGDEIWYLTYSPDGSQLASGSDDHLVVLWDPQGKKPVRVLSGHSGGITCLAYAPDGFELASGSTDNTVRRWDPHGEKPSRALEGHSHFVRCLAYTKDSKRLVSGSRDKTVRQWELRAPNEKPNRTLVGHSRKITCLVSAPDGLQLASGSMDGTVRLWDSRGEKPSQVLEALGEYRHIGFIECLVYSPDGSQLASISEMDYMVRLWDPHNATLSRVLKAKEPNMETGVSILKCLAYSSDSAQLVSAGLDAPDNMIRVWDPREGKLTQSLKAKERITMNCLAYSPDGSQLALVGSNYIVYLCDPQGKKDTIKLGKHSKTIKCLVYAPDGAQLASGGEDSMIGVWNPNGKGRNFRLKGHTKPITCMAYSPDGAQLASGSEDTQVRVWDAKRYLTLSEDVKSTEEKSARPGNLHGKKKPPCLITLKGHSKEITCLIYSPDGAQLASGSNDKTVRIWDIMTGKCLQVLMAPASVNALIWRLYNLFIGCGNGTLAAFRFNSGVWELVWLQGGKLPELDLRGCDFTGVEGLTSLQTILIEQHGGIHLPTMTSIAETKSSYSMSTAMSSSSSSSAAMSSSGLPKSDVVPTSVNFSEIKLAASPGISLKEKSTALTTTTLIDQEKKLTLTTPLLAEEKDNDYSVTASNLTASDKQRLGGWMSMFREPPKTQVLITPVRDDEDIEAQSVSETKKSCCSCIIF